MIAVYLIKSIIVFYFFGVEAHVYQQLYERSRIFDNCENENDAKDFRQLQIVDAGDDGDCQLNVTNAEALEFLNISLQAGVKENIKYLY